MTTTEILEDKLKAFEGLSLRAYTCPGGKLTIGYGHTGKDVREGDRISEYWARELLKSDIAEAERQVKELNVTKTEGQLDALVSFVFNLGIGRLKASTLLKVIRQGGSKAQITREFKKWVYAAGGKRLKGLERRREWEARHFFE